MSGSMSRSSIGVALTSRHCGERQPAPFAARYERAGSRARHGHLVLMPEGHDEELLAKPLLHSRVRRAASADLFHLVAFVEQAVELRVLYAPSIRPRGRD